MIKVEVQFVLNVVMSNMSARYLRELNPVRIALGSQWLAELSEYKCKCLWAASVYLWEVFSEILLLYTRMVCC